MDILEIWRSLWLKGILLLYYSLITRMQSSLYCFSFIEAASVVMDSDGNLQGHRKALTRSAFCHLKNIPRIKGLMSQQNL